MQKPNRAAYTAAEFLDWSSTKALVLSPKFQRRGVWQSAARSFFIDTLLREMPVRFVFWSADSNNDLGQTFQSNRRDDDIAWRQTLQALA